MARFKIRLTMTLRLSKFERQVMLTKLSTPNDFSTVKEEDAVNSLRREFFRMDRIEARLNELLEEQPVEKEERSLPWKRDTVADVLKHSGKIE